MPKKQWYVVLEGRMKGIHFEEYQQLVSKLKETCELIKIRKFKSKNEAEKFFNESCAPTADLRKFQNFAEDEFINQLESYKDIICTHSGKGLIHIAVEKSFSCAIDIMINLGFNLNLRSSSKEYCRITERQYNKCVALHYAVIHLKYDITKKLIDAGANTSIKTLSDTENANPARILESMAKRKQYCYHDEITKMASLFNIFEHSELKITFSDGNLIDRIEIKRKSGSILEGKSGSSTDKKTDHRVICHRKSYQTMKDRFQLKYEKQDAAACAVAVNEKLKARNHWFYFDSPPPKGFNRIECGILLEELFSLKSRNEKNLFWGSALANQSLNWLNMKLQSISSNSREAVSKLSIPPRYAVFFSISERFCEYYEEDDNYQPYIKIHTDLVLQELKKLSEVDKEENYPSFLYDKAPNDHVILVNEWLLKESQTITEPKSTPIPQEYLEYFQTVRYYRRFVEGSVFQFTTQNSDEIRSRAIGYVKTLSSAASSTLSSSSGNFTLFSKSWENKEQEGTQERLLPAKRKLDIAR